MGELLGDGAGAGAGGPDELRAIVARAGRRMRWRSAALAGSVALVAGGGVGYAVSGTGGSGRQVVATAPASAGSGSRASGAASGAASNGAASSAVPTAGGPSIAYPGSTPYLRVFNRQANGVDIRGFMISMPVMLPAMSNDSSACGTVGTTLQVEVSTSNMVGIASGGLVESSSGSLLSQQAEVLGQAEGDPIAVVVVRTGQDVAKVTMDFTGGATDSMIPVKGWSALAAPAQWYSAPSTKTGSVVFGTLTALDSSGHTVGTATIQWPAPVTGTVSGGTVSGGGSSSGTGSSGTGSSGATTGQAAPRSAVLCPNPGPPTMPPCPPPATVTGTAYACPLVGVPSTGAPTASGSGSSG